MKDELRELQRQASELSRNTAGLPWRIASGGGDSEAFRLIRGQSVGIQSGATVLIDNVVVLSGGEDPSAGDPAVQVVVYNLFGQTYSDNEWIDAVYSPAAHTSPDADWETLKATTGTDKKRLIQGLTTGAVAAQTTTFDIDHVTILAGGLDPRVTPGDATEHISIYKNTKESFEAAGVLITAIYIADTDTWRLIATERFRAIRGKWYSGTSTIVIDHIVVLDSGGDPRTDPTDVTEQVTVTKISGDNFTSGDDVWADWSVANDRWEARPKPGSGGGGTIVWGIVTTEASGSTAAGSATNDGRGTLFGAYGGTTGVVLNNYYPDVAPVGAVFSMGDALITWSCGTLDLP